MYITYITKEYPNKLNCIHESMLSTYILTEEEQQYIDGLTDDSVSRISSLMLSAAVKAGSTLFTQPELNSLYARKDDADFTPEDRNNLKEFLNTRMVGNNIIDFEELA